MTLPEPFNFNQGNLQDFSDCRRRFQLRHLLQLAWPALEAEPAMENERYLLQGALFHRMIQQHLSGVLAERLSQMAAEQEDLQRWWDHYLGHFTDLTFLPELGAVAPRRYPELALSAPLNGHRLSAKYDLVVVAPGMRAVIFDWKTSRKRPRRSWLAERWQTRVYPYLLVQAGAHLNQGRPLQPDQIELVYWFAEFPDQPERFPYNTEQYRTDGQELARLVRLIASLGEDDFIKTERQERCLFCIYRSLCRRGVSAGGLGELEDFLDEIDDETLDAGFNFEQIAEIEY